MAYGKRRLNELSMEEMFEIYNKTNSGRWYVKELCVDFDISPYVYREVLKVVQGIIDYELYGKKNYQV